MDEIADIVILNKNKLTLAHEVKLFVPNILFSITVPSQEGYVVDQCLNSTPLPAVVQLIGTVRHRLMFVFDSVKSK